MATLTRKYLSSLGIEEEKVDLIIERHTEVVSEIKEERDKYKEDADQLPALKKQIESYESDLKDGNKDSYKVKYEALKEDFDEFKQKIESEKTSAKKENAYRELLKECGISDKRIASVLKVSDISSLEFDDEGNVKDVDKLRESIKDEWSDFIQTKSSEGVKTANPPAKDGKATKTKEEIRAISDPVARQKAMMENPTLFNLPESDE